MWQQISTNFNYWPYSSDSDDEINSKKENDNKAVDEAAVRQQRINDQLEKMILIDVVQNNEKTDGFNASTVEDAFDFFGENSEFDIPLAYRKLLEHKVLKRLSEYVYSNTAENYGLPLCIKLFSDYIFVGFSLGVVRIFDIKSGEEIKKLIPK
jgi:hypothetical protein